MSAGRFTRTSTVVLVAFLLVIAAGLIAGCVPPSESVAPAPEDPAPRIPEKTLSLDEISDLSMSLGAKADLYPGFPAQLPVMDGEVLDVRPLPVEGGGDWTYALEVDAEYGVVFEWYSRAYPIASWQITSVSAVGIGPESGVLLEFAKGNAVSRITVLPDGGSTRVEAGISIGGDGAVEL